MKKRDSAERGKRYQVMKMPSNSRERLKFIMKCKELLNDCK